MVMVLSDSNHRSSNQYLKKERSNRQDSMTPQVEDLLHYGELTDPPINGMILVFPNSGCSTILDPKPRDELVGMYLHMP